MFFRNLPAVDSSNISRFICSFIQVQIYRTKNSIFVSFCERTHAFCSHLPSKSTTTQNQYSRYKRNSENIVETLSKDRISLKFHSCTLPGTLLMRIIYLTQLFPAAVALNRRSSRTYRCHHYNQYCHLRLGLSTALKISCRKKIRKT